MFKSDTFMVEHSLRSIQAVRYTAKHTNVDGYILVLHVLIQAGQRLCLIVALQKTTSKSYPCKIDAWDVRSPDTYETEYTSKLLGFATPQDCYNQLHLNDSVGEVTPPMLVMGQIMTSLLRKLSNQRKKLWHSSLTRRAMSTNEEVDTLMPQNRAF
jgi:hypothetical protein